MKAVIYARVSSTGDRQSTERQIIDLTDYANKNSIETEPWIVVPGRSFSLLFLESCFF